tara:strand:- start:306 stop:629 length:324 start_codon:yes stop_codon:yes gene_type:complete
MVANLFLIRQVNKGTPPLRVEGNLMTNITTFVKHDDLIVNVETRGPIGGTENDYVTKVYFGETEYASPVVVDFFHKGKDVDILQLLKVRGDEKSVILDTRRESLTLP